MIDMRKIKSVMSITIIAAMALTSCAPKSEDEITLTNHMTDTELERAEKTDLLLLDESYEPEGAQGYDGVAISFETKQDMLEYIDDYPEDFETEEQRLAAREQVMEDYDDDYRRIYCAFVNGALYYDLLPPVDYDGGAGETFSLHYPEDEYDPLVYTIEFEDYDDFKAKLALDIEQRAEDGTLIIEGSEAMYDNVVAIYDAVMTGDYETVTDDELWDLMLEAREEDTDLGPSTWELNRDEVGKLRDSIAEYHIYDEELDKEFVVHVITPADYDPSEKYPVITLTDAVWRFGDVVDLRREMDEGRCDPMIIITIGISYNEDATDNEVRADIFCVRKKEFLDFITDNLMPYLSEIYPMDFENSTFFGHSQGGVFSHYAAFNYDLYENQPFSSYIIGSPAFWTPYFTCLPDWSDYQDEYGFFDRNTEYTKTILITGGEYEDADYSEYYGENESTLEGIQSLAERLEAHGVANCQVQLYQTHHYQYITGMLTEYVREAGDE